MIEAASVELHLVNLDVDDTILDACRAVLSPNERDRAARFRFPHLQRRFAVARGALRMALARKLGGDPASLEFTYGPQGKPFLRGIPELSFNLAHSEELALMAIVEDRLVGVDIERINANADVVALSAVACTPRERKALQALPERMRPAAFYEIWTRKEALLKAIGVGLAHPPNELDVTVVRVPEWPSLAGKPVWSLHGLAVGHGFAAAIAVEGDVPPPQNWSQ